MCGFDDIPREAFLARLADEPNEINWKAEYANLYRLFKEDRYYQNAIKTLNANLADQQYNRIAWLEIEVREPLFVPEFYVWSKQLADEPQCVLGTGPSIAEALANHWARLRKRAAEHVDATADEKLLTGK
jgi:hypothetical protein